MKHLGDITKIDGRTVPRVEVVIGGSPCQDLSVAGKRAGLAGERSGLFMEQIRIIKEMRERDRNDGRADRDVFPRFMVWENVPGAFSSNGGEDFRAVLEETVRVAEPTAVVPRYEGGRWTNAGAIIGDGWSLAWRVHDAQYWGVPQRRRRIALVADFNGLSAADVLFERDSGGAAGSEIQSVADGVRGDHPSSRAEREGAAGEAERGAREAGVCDGAEITCPTNWSNPKPGDPPMPLTEDAGRTICIQENIGVDLYDGVITKDIAATLSAFSAATGSRQGPYVLGFKLGNSSRSRSIGLEENVSPTLNSECGGNKPAVMYDAPKTICIQGNCIDRSDTAGCNGRGWNDEDVSYTLNTIDRPAVMCDDHRQDSGLDLYNGAITGDVAATLNANTGLGSNHAGPTVMAVSQNADGIVSEHEVMNAITTNQNASGRGTGLVYGLQPQARGNTGFAIAEERGPCLGVTQIPGVMAFRSSPGKNAYGMELREEVAPVMTSAPGRNIPAVYDARGNGDGETDPTITGDHENRVTDYTAVCVGDGHADIGSHITEEIAQSLSCMHDQLAVMTMNALGAYKECDVASAMKSRDYKDATDLVIQEHDATEDGVQRVTGPLMASGYAKNGTQEVKNGMYVAAVDCRNAVENDINETLQAKSNGGTSVNLQNICRQNTVVRRLTPLECERLQGYPDGWTDIGDWIDSKGKRRVCSDSNRYRALGNSIALPYWYFLLRRISERCAERTMASLFDGIGGFPLCWEAINGRGSCLWASEIEEFCVAVTKARFGDADRTD